MLQHRLHDESLADIVKAGNAVARALEDGHRIWVTNTAHGVAHEVTKRAGGFIAVHELIDVVHMQPGDCVLIGSPVGVATHTLSFALGASERGGIVVALTNVAFEQEPSTIIEHPSGSRLHEVADIVVDIGGPTGDGVFELTDLNFRVIPHSGVTLVTALWMIFSEALAVMRSHGVIPGFISATWCKERESETHFRLPDTSLPGRATSTRTKCPESHPWARVVVGIGDRARHSATTDVTRT